MKTPGQRVSYLRVKRGLSQKELAERIHVSRDVVAKWENDSKRSIPNESLVNLSDFFDVSTDYLLRGTKAKKLDNIKIVNKYGLSEEALGILEDCYSRQKNNSITLSINALIEDRNVLELISWFLYYNLKIDENRSDVVPYEIEYRYMKDSDDGGWGGSGKITPVDVGCTLNAFDNQMYKRIVLLEIQDKLRDLLEKEDRIERLNQE